MTKWTNVMLTLAVVGAVGLVAGCEGDPSARTRPRTGAGPLEPSSKAKENADKRELEEKKPDFPTSGKEFPGQSKAAPAAGTPVVLADASKPPHGNVQAATPLNKSDSVLPETRYNRDYYPGPIPHLPENPGITPMAGTTHVPGTGWSIDHSWGEVLVLKGYPHRDWPAMQATYMAANVKNNPVYYFNIQDRLPVTQDTGSYASDWLNNLYEIPWFYAQTAALPVTAFLQNPLAQVTTQRLGRDPNYFAYLPPTGAVVPVQMEGLIRWDYPFLMTTGQDVTTMPSSPPIMPTPGMGSVPKSGAPGSVVPIEPASPTPGLQ